VTSPAAPTVTESRKIDAAAAVHTAASVPGATAAVPRKGSPRVPPKTGRGSNLTASAAAIAIPSVVSEAPVESALPAPEPVVPAPAPAPEAPAAPIGPFFEVRSVDQAPQVASRVEPLLPESLQGQSLHEIVIVRILVSQSGQPALVSLLRRSKSGPELDSAVVAAVRQWKFTPAAKRGQAVSCYLHVGVAVGRTE
jgi:periplasmic protein TonB